MSKAAKTASPKGEVKGASSPSVPAAKANVTASSAKTAAAPKNEKVSSPAAKAGAKPEAAASKTKTASPAAAPAASPTSPKSPGGYTATPSTGRDCSVCHKKQLADCFSHKQWSEVNANKRKCKKCIEWQEAHPQPQQSPKLKAEAEAAAAAAASAAASARRRNNRATSPRKVTSPVQRLLNGSASRQRRAPILDSKSNWFTPDAEAVFISIFNRFDADKDGAWTVNEIQSFAQFTNGAMFSKDELTEIKTNLQHDKAGNLTRQGFLDFYTLQTQSHPDETFRDLLKLGYDHNLKQVV